MPVLIINLELVKKHLRVTHSQSDDLIQAQLSASIEQTSHYLNKQIYEDKSVQDQAVTDGADAEKVILISESINNAIALLVEHKYYGVSAMGADKLEAAALNLLHPDRYLVGW